LIDAARNEIDEVCAANDEQCKQNVMDKHLHYDDAQNFLDLMKELRAGLDGLNDGHKILSTAINQAPQNSLLIPYGEMSHYIDSINLMTYDSTGAWASHTGNQAALSNAEGADSSYYSVSEGKWNVMAAVQALKDGGVPSNKIVVGLPLYGRVWGKVEPGTSGIPLMYQPGQDSFTQVEDGNVDYKCLLGQGQERVCAEFGDSAKHYTFILARSKSDNVLVRLSNYGEVVTDGYMAAQVDEQWQEMQHTKKH
jgi:GH18 family chitinase